MQFSAFRSSTFRTYFFGVIFSVHGLWMLMISVSWTAWVISGSAAYVGFVATIAMLPAIFIGPLFGVLIDRFNIKIAYYCTTLGMMIAGVALLLLTLNDAVTQSRLIVVAGFMGIVMAAHNPTRLSLGPRLVVRDHVSSVVTLAAMNFNTARVLSPALTGFIIDRYGLSAALICSILLYVPNLLVIWRLEPRPSRDAADTEGFVSALKGGFQYILQRPSLLWILLLSGLYNGSTRGTSELFSVIADGIFEKGALGLGQLGSAVGIGALAAALSKGLLDFPILQRLSLPVLAVASLAAVATMTIGGTGVWTIALGSATAMGFCATFLGITCQTAIQRDLPDTMRARVMSLWVVIAFGSPAIGAIVIGNLASAFDMGVATKVACLFALAGYLTIWLRYLRPWGLS